MIDRAQSYATEAHRGQNYGPTDKPYTYHLERVVAVLQRFGIEDENLLAAGWLHDIIEDTKTTAKDLHQEFGPRVAALVDAVTDGLGETREARKQRPYSLIPKVPDAVCLKLADRIANLEASIDEGHKRLLDRYAQEHTGFVAALYCGSYLPMWEYLAQLFEKHGCGNVGWAVVCSHSAEETQHE